MRFPRRVMERVELEDQITFRNEGGVAVEVNGLTLHPNGTLQVSGEYVEDFAAFPVPDGVVVSRGRAESLWPVRRVWRWR